MRSTTRPRLAQVLPARTTGNRWGKRLLLALRVAFAAATVVATFAVLTQDPPLSQSRWLLAFLASSLFVVSVLESEIVRREADREERGANSNQSQDGGSHQDTQLKIGQFARHRTDYIYTMSHELKTPLTSIRGFAELLAKDETIRKTSGVYADTIVQEAVRLSSIVDDIIDLTRMESTLLDLRIDPLPTADLIHEVAEQLRSPEMPDKLILDIPANLPWVRGDRDRIAQVLGRLLLEAISRTEPNDTIAVVARAGEDSVAIRLRYTATTAQASSMARALEGLWQCGGEKHATRLGQGELGLYIARNLIEAHGGRVSLEHADNIVAVSIELPT